MSAITYDDTVASTVYRLRDDLVIVEQQSSGKPYFVVQNAATGRVYGFNLASIRVLKSLDGTTSVDDLVARITRPGSDPERVRNSVVSLIDRARDAGLLDGIDAAPEPPKAWWRRFNPFYIQLGVKDPTPVFERVQRVFFPLFTTAAFGVLLLGLGGSVFLIARDPHRFWNSFLIFGFFRWWLAAYLLLAVATVLHETGHAMACMRYGGRVRSIGFLLYLFQPACYTTVTDAWLFPRKLHRVIVSLAGVYFEGFLFCAAIAVWYFARPFSAPYQVAFVFAIILLTRVILNLIPFLRLDGYFVLMDLVDVKNLRPRSFAYVLSLVPYLGRRWRPKAKLPLRERLILFSYGLIALAFVTAAISQVIRAVHWRLAHWHGIYGTILFWSIVAALIAPSIASIYRMVSDLQERK